MTSTTAPPLHGLLHDMPDAEYHSRPELSSTGVAEEVCRTAANGSQWELIAVDEVAS